MTVQIVSTVRSPATDDALVELDEIKTELQIDLADTSNDEWLGRAIGQVSRSIMSYCNRRFARETIEDQVFIQQDPFPYQTPGGIVALQLSRWPVINLQSVVQKLALNSSNTLTADKDYKLDADRGELYRLDQFTGIVIRWEALPVTITYEAGFDQIPDDVVVSALRWLVWRWNERTRDPTLKATQQPDLGTKSYWVGGPPMSGGVPQEIAALLDNYRVRVIY